MVVEGQSEEGFVNEVLAPDLGAQGIFLDAHSITTGRKKGRVHRGGWGSYDKLRRDLMRWMKQHRNPDAWFTTMVDLYGLPDDFPGRRSGTLIADPAARVEHLEQQLARDIGAALAEDGDPRRFIPYIQLHEFESLLFSDPHMFLSAFPDQHAVVHNLLDIRAQAGGPERIDDGETTAPSKRILRLLPDYVKTVSGLLVAKQIGLATMRRECPHFNRWIDRIVEAGAG